MGSDNGRVVQLLPFIGWLYRIPKPIDDWVERLATFRVYIWPTFVVIGSMYSLVSTRLIIVLTSVLRHNRLLPVVARVHELPHVFSQGLLVECLGRNHALAEEVLGIGVQCRTSGGTGAVPVAAAVPRVSVRFNRHSIGSVVRHMAVLAAFQTVIVRVKARIAALTH